MVPTKNVLERFLGRIDPDSGDQRGSEQRCRTSGLQVAATFQMCSDRKQKHILNRNALTYRICDHVLRWIVVGDAAVEEFEAVDVVANDHTVKISGRHHASLHYLRNRPIRQIIAHVIFEPECRAGDIIERWNADLAY